MIDRNYTWDLRSANTVPYAYQLGYFTASECDQIIALAQKHAAIESYLGQAGNVDNNIRRNTVTFFSNTDTEVHWVYQRISQAVTSFNQQFWRFDLDFVETLQFTIYDRVGDFYTNHMDMSFGQTEQRKLSVSVQLSDPDSYTGSNLEIMQCGDQYFSSIRDRGAIIMFPSYMQHRVTALTSGRRYSLVSWVVGAPYR